MMETEIDMSPPVAEVLNSDGTVFDECYTWEAAQNYALHEGRVVRALTGDGFMSKEDIQKLCDSELQRHLDCFGSPQH